MRFAPVALIALLGFGPLIGCESSGADGQTGISSIVIPPITLPSGVLESALSAAASTGQSVAFHIARFGCGPTDGAWIDVQLLSTTELSVDVQVHVGAAEYGQSDTVLLDPGHVTAVGFDPQLDGTAFGALGRLSVVDAATPSVELASYDLVLGLPEGETCPPT